MGKSKTKRKTKKRQQDSMIRTDVWTLKVTSSQKQLLLLTVAESRKFLNPLVFIVNSEWKLMGNLTDKEKVNYLEKSIHVTSQNPQIKYSYYQKVINKYPSFRKFPSYLRREDSDYVCSVDLGINNAATCSIVGRDGTVKARKFINPARDIDRRNKRKMMITKKSKQTAKKTGQKLVKGF
ncbi:MAG: hypothetical protein QNJ33_09250 [Crocosphaera sp.]|nr:hypothetical protein [Crocosphaera sp.]